jgi:rRNA processing protein Krr1/Pno1
MSYYQLVEKKGENFEILGSYTSLEHVREALKSFIQFIKEAYIVDSSEDFVKLTNGWLIFISKNNNNIKGEIKC